MLRSRQHDLDWNNTRFEAPYLLEHFRIMLEAKQKKAFMVIQAKVEGSPYGRLPPKAVDSYKMQVCCNEIHSHS